MRWEELEDALEVLETEREYDGYFCSIKDVSYHRDFGKSCMVVADALNCQRETAEAIVEAQADYLLSAKGNQKELMNDIEQYVQDEKLHATMDSVTRTEKGHGRIERRSAYTNGDISWQPGGREWPTLKCIGAVHTRFETSKGVTPVHQDEWILRLN